MSCASGAQNSKERTNTHAGLKEVAVFYFVPGTVELVDGDLNGVCARLDLSEKYRIHGYACNKDGRVETELLDIAEKRAAKIWDVLVDRGFSPDNLSTIAYDKGTHCKTVILKIDK